jgi:hypothetical protein
MNKEIIEFLRTYPDIVQDLARRLDKVIISTIPGVREEFDRSARVIGYGLGPGYAGVICTIILSKKGVKLGIVRGAQLSNSHRLLEGSGKLHRHVVFEQPSDFERPGLQALLETAFAAWQKRTAAKT